jgi:hypothetical protein
MTERPDDFERVGLILARQRRMGQPFEAAWPKAVEALTPLAGDTTDARNRQAALGALTNTVEAWQAGYERRAPPPPAYPSAEIETALRGADRAGPAGCLIAR